MRTDNRDARGLSPSRAPDLSRLSISHARPLARIHPQVIIISRPARAFAVPDRVVVVPPKGEPRADAAKPAFARVDVKVGQGKGEQLAHRVADGRGLAVGRAGRRVLNKESGVRGRFFRLPASLLSSLSSLPCLAAAVGVVVDGLVVDDDFAAKTGVGAAGTGRVGLAAAAGGSPSLPPSLAHRSRACRLKATESDIK